MNIIVRATEPTDIDAIRETMAQPRAYAGTLQVPLPSAEMWKKRGRAGVLVVLQRGMA